jgi:hypothetical protein
MMGCLCGSESKSGLLVTASDDVVDFPEKADGACAFVIDDTREVITLDLEISAVPVDVAQSSFSEVSFDLSYSSGGNFVSNLNDGHLILRFLLRD